MDIVGQGWLILVMVTVAAVILYLLRWRIFPPFLRTVGKTPEAIRQGYAQGAPRHADVARSTPRQLAWKWIKDFKWHLLFLFLSDYGREIMERKYDAFTTDRAYENRPSGRWLIGKLVDWVVLQQDTHVALRQRLAAVVEELVGVTLEFRNAGANPVRVVSGPCGLARDLRLTWKRLEETGKAPRGWLQLVGLDLDFTGEVLPAVQRLADKAQVPITVDKQDLLDTARLKERFKGQPVHVFLSIGLTVWLDPSELEQMLGAIHALLEPGGLLLVDNFRPHASSRYLEDFEINARYHSDPEFESQLRNAGFALEKKIETPNRVNVLYGSRK